jgi:hypothetical protein
MLKTKPDPEYAILAIDPGGRFAGLALWHSQKLEGFDCMIDMDFNVQTLARLAGLMLDPALHLLIVSEYPTPGTPCGPQVRQAANILIARLKKLYPKRAKVIKVVPQTWQSRVTKGLPGKNPKDRSLYRARLDYYIGPELLKSLDIADALNLLTYARGFVTWRDGK